MAIEHIEQFGKGEIRNMDKDTILKSELRGFNINIDDVKPNDDIFGALEEAIVKMRSEYLINRLALYVAHIHFCGTILNLILVSISV